MVANDACRAAILAAAICLTPFHPAHAAAPAAAEAVATTPGERLTELAGKTFGFMGSEGDEPSLLVRFEQVPGQGFRITEIDEAGTVTSTVAADQRGPRWKGRFLMMPVDFDAKETVTVAPDGALLLAWSAWGTTSERSFRLLPGDVLERRAHKVNDDTYSRETRLVLLDAEQETVLLDQIALEGELFRQEVAAQTKILMAEADERRRQNREKFWNGVAQATLVLATAAAEVAAEMDHGDRGVMAGMANASHGVPTPASPAPAGTDSTAGPPPAAAPLRFVMMVGLMNKPGDTVNPMCYSNIVTRPGPPGWGAPGFLPSGSGEQARQAVESLRDRFLALCRTSGREITSAGNFSYHWNRSPGDEQRVTDARPRHAEDVLVSVD